jgi:hypothetical protein
MLGGRKPQEIMVVVVVMKREGGTWQFFLEQSLHIACTYQKRGMVTCEAKQTGEPPHKLSSSSRMTHKKLREDLISD